MIIILQTANCADPYQTAPLLSILIRILIFQRYVCQNILMLMIHLKSKAHVSLGSLMPLTPRIPQKGLLQCRHKKGTCLASMLFALNSRTKDNILCKIKPDALILEGDSPTC